MKYTIISVSDRREDYKKDIRAELSSHEEVTDIKFYTAADDCAGLLKSVGIEPVWTGIRGGELGVWCSQISVWKWIVEHDESLMIFEDDAIIYPGFDDWRNGLGYDELDYDAVSLFVPSGQFGDWNYDYVGHSINIHPGASPNHDIGHDRMARAYQGFSCVGLHIAPSGARKLIKAIEEVPHMPVDCYIFETGFPDSVRHCAERTQILAPQPKFATGVEVYWKAETHIHNTDLV